MLIKNSCKVILEIYKSDYHLEIMTMSNKILAFKKRTSLTSSCGAVLA